MCVAVSTTRRRTHLVRILYHHLDYPTVPNLLLLLSLSSWLLLICDIQLLLAWLVYIISITSATWATLLEIHIHITNYRTDGMNPTQSINQSFDRLLWYTTWIIIIDALTMIDRLSSSIVALQRTVGLSLSLSLTDAPHHSRISATREINRRE